MGTLNYIFGALALLSLLLGLWQWSAGRRFPLHHLLDRPDFFPPITVLKPLKGCDAETLACLRSWFRQDYSGPLQILFGVASADDPICELVKRLIAEHPTVRAELLICSELLGANAKVSTLAHLQKQAEHDVLVISDADVRISSTFLVNIVAPLMESDIGLVNCFYRLADPSTMAMEWEAVAVNADFWTQVLQGRDLKPLDFALGAVMATRRKELEGIGGFVALVNHLADDYELGNRIAVRGARIELSNVVVDCWSPPMGWAEVWAHQLRWARTIRACQPVPYFFSILSNGTLWPLIWLAVNSSMFAGGVFAICLMSRVWTAASNNKKLTGRSLKLWIVPVKDLLQVALWGMSFLGRHVVWRGHRYIVYPNGELREMGH